MFVLAYVFLLRWVTIITVVDVGGLNTRRLLELTDPERDVHETGLERKKEAARKRAKSVRESAIFAKRKRERTLTPGVKIIGSRLFEDDAESSTSEVNLEEDVKSYILERGGFVVTGENKVDTLTLKRDSEDVMNVRLSRIVGFHDRWGLDRKFFSSSIHAHRFEDGAIIEYSLQSYGGYISRTYYVVDGNEFRAFVQHNYRKERSRE
jgi:hypothetical protein